MYFDRSDGAAYVGDVAGCGFRLRGHPSTDTAPDIDVEAWEGSIDLVASRRPSWLALTTSERRRATSHLERMKWRLREQAELVRGLLEKMGDTDEAAAALWRDQQADSRILRSRDGGGVRAGRATEAALGRASSILAEAESVGVPDGWYHRSMTTEISEKPRTDGPGTGSGGWRVIVLNDNHNTFDHVAKTLARVIPNVTVESGHRWRTRSQLGTGDRLDGRARAGRALLGN